MEAWREDQLNALLAPDEQEDMFAMVARLARGLGFEHCAYGMRAPFAVAQGEIVMLNDYPLAWQQRYSGNDYLKVDPTVQRGAASLDAFVWSNTGNSCDVAAGFWEDSRQHGIDCGVSLPALAANSVRGMLSVSRGGGALDESEMRQNWTKLVWLGQVAHHGLTRQLLRNRRASVAAALSGREKEVLRWVAEGLTNQQIAERTGIVERTVNFHLNRAMGKLEVGNRTATAVRAVVLGVVA
ncbi:MAG: LuxR family transcriptional regulator [Stenotrophomonas sp.]